MGMCNESKGHHPNMSGRRSRGSALPSREVRIGAQLHAYVIGFTSVPACNDHIAGTPQQRLSTRQLFC